MMESQLSTDQQVQHFLLVLRIPGKILPEPTPKVIYTMNDETDSVITDQAACRSVMDPVCHGALMCPTAFVESHALILR